MQFKRIEQKSVIRAILFGSVSGLVGVALFIFLLQQTAPMEAPMPVVEQQDTPPVEETKTFYAAQHGTFSSLEAATTYMKMHPTLNLAAVIEVAGQFYIWSEIATAAQWEKAIVIPTSFAKTFQVISTSCTEQSLKNAPVDLANDANLIPAQLSNNELAHNWGEVVESIGQLTTNEKVVRLHVLAELLKTSCMSITF